MAISKRYAGLNPREQFRELFKDTYGRNPTANEERSFDKIGDPVRAVGALKSTVKTNKPVSPGVSGAGVAGTAVDSPGALPKNLVTPENVVGTQTTGIPATPSITNVVPREPYSGLNPREQFQAMFKDTYGRLPVKYEESIFNELGNATEALSALGPIVEATKPPTGQDLSPIASQVPLGFSPEKRIALKELLSDPAFSVSSEQPGQIPDDDLAAYDEALSASEGIRSREEQRATENILGSLQGRKIAQSGIALKEIIEKVLGPSAERARLASSEFGLARARRKSELLESQRGRAGALNQARLQGRLQAILGEQTQAGGFDLEAMKELNAAARLEKELGGRISLQELMGGQAREEGGREAAYRYALQGLVGRQGMNQLGQEQEGRISLQELLGGQRIGEINRETEGRYDLQKLIDSELQKK